MLDPVDLRFGRPRHVIAERVRGEADAEHVRLVDGSGNLLPGEWSGHLDDVCPHPDLLPDGQAPVARPVGHPHAATPLERFGPARRGFRDLIGVTAAARDQLARPEDARGIDHVPQRRFLEPQRHIVDRADVTHAGDPAVDELRRQEDAAYRRSRRRITILVEIVAALLLEVHVEIDQPGDDRRTSDIDDASRIRGGAHGGCRAHCKNAVALKDEHGVRHRLGARAVDERAALEHQNRVLGRIARRNRNPPRVVSRVRAGPLSQFILAGEVRGEDGQ